MPPAAPAQPHSSPHDLPSFRQLQDAEAQQTPALLGIQPQPSRLRQLSCVDVQAEERHAIYLGERADTRPRIPSCASRPAASLRLLD
mmetsp:Transcript_7638/g.23856  ORF Transcript_7638/g.23856 Transcript_7638/m.23856 type:complete len:87 (+) Transcript_7638:1735-1995(+)